VLKIITTQYLSAGEQNDAFVDELIFVPTMQVYKKLKNFLLIITGEYNVIYRTKFDFILSRY
jgi:hypothetical protein